MFIIIFILILINDYVIISLHSIQDKLTVSYDNSRKISEDSVCHILEGSLLFVVKIKKCNQ